MAYLALMGRWWMIWTKQNNLKKKVEKQLEPWHMGTHLIVLSEGFSMNTDMTGFR